MRDTGIDDKMCFYVRRFSEKEIGSYFEYRVDKEVCSLNENYRFYLKIGGVTFLSKKPVPGKKISTSAERVKESKYFGSYVYYAETDKKIRCLLYCKRKGLQDMKLVGQPACLHSIIPRYDGTLRDCVITGMRVTGNIISDRRWSRFDCKTKAEHKGFNVITHDQYLTEVFNNVPNWDAAGPKIGIYVGANTSLVMVDHPRAHLYCDYARNFVYTLFQEGAFICTNRTFTYCFYDYEESEEYDGLRFIQEMFPRMLETPNLDRVTDVGALDKIIFLKSAPNHTFWTLRANKWRRHRETEMMLCIPTGGQFENILYWDEGIAEVTRRQSFKPWKKYTESVNEHDPQFEDIDLDKNEAYPQ